MPEPRRPMDPAGLERLAFFAGLPGWALEALAGAAREEEAPAGRTVLHQHDRVGTVHFLIDGALQILVRVGDDDLLVGVLDGHGELVGWSAFRPPYRSTATVRCERPSRLVAVPVLRRVSRMVVVAAEPRKAQRSS